MKLTRLAKMFAAAPSGFNFELTPPSGFTDFFQLADGIADYLYKIALPLAFIMILYAGVRFLWARGNPEEISNAKRILWYTIIGLAIVLINKGFIALISDILGVTTP